MVSVPMFNPNETARIFHACRMEVTKIIWSRGYPDNQGVKECGCGKSQTGILSDAEVSAFYTTQQSIDDYALEICECKF